MNGIGRDQQPPYSKALVSRAKELGEYMQLQGVDEFREKDSPDFPFPDNGDDNIMLEYLFARAFEHFDQSGMTEAIAWLGVHAWREGALDALSRLEAK